MEQDRRIYIPGKPQEILFLGNLHYLRDVYSSFIAAPEHRRGPFIQKAREAMEDGSGKGFLRFEMVQMKAWATALGTIGTCRRVELDWFIDDMRILGLHDIAAYSGSSPEVPPRTHQEQKLIELTQASQAIREDEDRQAAVVQEVRAKEDDGSGLSFLKYQMLRLEFTYALDHISSNYQEWKWMKDDMQKLGLEEVANYGWDQHRPKR